jgi:hypothetical protein
MERALLSISVVVNAALAIWLAAPSTCPSTAHISQSTAQAALPSSPRTQGPETTSNSDAACRAELAAARAEINAAGVALRQMDEADMKRIYEGGESRPAVTKAVAAILGEVVDRKAAFECHDVVCHYEVAAPSDGTDPTLWTARHPWSSALFEREQFGPDGVWARLRDHAPEILNGKEALDLWLGVMTSTSSLSQTCGALPSDASLQGSVDANGVFTATASGVASGDVAQCIERFVAANTPSPLTGIPVTPATLSVPLVPSLPNAAGP